MFRACCPQMWALCGINVFLNQECIVSPPPQRLFWADFCQKSRFNSGLAFCCGAWQFGDSRCGLKIVIDRGLMVFMFCGYASRDFRCQLRVTKMILCRKSHMLAAVLSLALAVLAAGVQAQSTGYRQGVTEAARGNQAILEFYVGNGLQPLWTGPDKASLDRRVALLEALAGAADHGLPRSYDAQLLTSRLRAAGSQRELGQIEVEVTKLFLAYAQDVRTGILVPGQANGDVFRTAPELDQAQLLASFSKSQPGRFIRALPPSSPEYARLMKHKILLERVVAGGGWGAVVPRGKYEIGDTGSGVIALRNRLIAMGFLGRTAKADFGPEMARAIEQFQTVHGLTADGVAGAGTIEEINVSAERRLGAVLVAMERERWMNFARGERHIWVNIPDYSAVIMDGGKESFRTRAVVGASNVDRRTPEFSDEMEHMVINPSWYVPRSITVKEYLPQLQRNPRAVSNLQLLGRSGNVVSRQGIDFTQFDARSFPFSLKEPPSRNNALGLVKFMFPNRHNIYLHDTPAKNLFGREARAFSHGCVRLSEPFDFAYALLARQTADPEGFFQATLNTGAETTVDLDIHVPVHLVYRTAFTDARGNLQFRRDVYGRDGRLIDALLRAGVAIPGLGS